MRNYKYRGGDRSITYSLVLSPLAEKSLALVPRWVAPNTLTSIGMVCSASAYLLIYWYCYDFTCREAPAWVTPLAGLGFFLYQTLDNMDGKQARRTGTSSALGLLFDHGCDAINCIFGTAFTAICIGVGPSLPLVVLCFGNATIPFFWATWEQYYLGELVLPFINGPSEGLILGVILACAQYWTGVDVFWEPQPWIGGLVLGTTLIFTSFFFIFVTAFVQTVKVTMRCRKEGLSLMAPLGDTAGFVLMWVLGGLWLGSVSRLFEEAPHTLIFLFGAVNVELLAFLMFAHVVQGKYQSVRPVLLPLFLGWLNSYLRPGGAVLDEVLFLQAATLATVAMVSYNVYQLVMEMRGVLHIYVFSTRVRSKGA